ncbi:MAG: alcohol dehydrogenase catalytic domain-containing protein, partial [Rhodopila sp.]
KRWCLARSALEWADVADRQPGPNQIRVRVGVRGVCRTDLHVLDGELPYPVVPVIPGLHGFGAAVSSLSPSLGRGRWGRRRGAGRGRG